MRSGPLSWGKSITIIPAFAVVSALLLSLFSWFVTPPNRLSGGSSTSLIAKQQLDVAIHDAARFLNESCQADGQFVYRINLDPDVEVAPKYNMLRHAGTMYSLAVYHSQYPNAETCGALERSGKFLLDRAIGTVSPWQEMLAVWSPPELTYSGETLQAKLGGAGLALTALISAENAGVPVATIEELRGLGRFLVYLQKEDGSFYSKYIPADGGRSDRWTSLYYPGEAALGLLYLYERDAQTRWLQAAADAIAHLARLREGQDVVEADHWALLATAKLLPVYEECEPPIPRDAVITHAKQICNSIIRERPTFPAWSPLKGGFAADGRTCPTATRLEGLLAARQILPQDDVVLREQIDELIVEGIDFLMRSQVTSREYVGAIPRAIKRLPSNHPLYHRDFNRRATEVRIDYVQHAMCAMLDFQQMEATR